MTPPVQSFLLLVVFVPLISSRLVLLLLRVVEARLVILVYDAVEADAHEFALHTEVQITATLRQDQQRNQRALQQVRVLLEASVEKLAVSLYELAQTSGEARVV